MSLTLDQIQEGQELPDLAIEVTPTTVVLGALATRDWRPMHHDKDFAQDRNGTRHIFINTPHNAAYFERYITDWTGPKGRPGRMNFRMKGSVFAGDHMTFRGVVDDVSEDEHGCGWVGIQVEVNVEGKTMTACQARFAVPTDKVDNPWSLEGERWNP